MKPSRATILLLCTITGVVGGITYLSRGDDSTHERRTMFFETPWIPAALVEPRREPEDQFAHAPATMSTDSSSEQDKTNIQGKRSEAARLKLAETAKQITDYAASFAPGVYGEELLPEFVTMAPVASTQNHANPSEDAVDGWSAEMDSRLRGFFGSQPQVLSSAQVGITCRALQCDLQIVALQSSAPDSGQHPMKMMDRLKREDWYGQNFALMSKSNTLWSPQITYELWTLRRGN